MLELKRVIKAAIVAEEAAAPTANGTEVVDPASLRSRLAEAAAASLDDIRRGLLETSCR